MNEVISIDKAIELTAGSRNYQKRALFILILGEAAICSFMLTNQLLLPTISCEKPSIDDCNIDDRLKNSAAFEFNVIGSNKYQVGLFRTIYFLGILMGSIIIPWLSDKYGRKIIVLYSCISGAALFTTASFAVNMEMLTAIAFGLGFFDVGFFIMSFVLYTEVLDYKYRNIYLMVYKSLGPVTAIVFILIYMSGLYWRYILLLSGSILVLECLLLPFVYESPRFLLTNLGDVKASTEVIKKISMINGIDDFPYTLKSENTSPSKSFGSVLAMFESKGIVLNLGVCGIIWFSLLFSFFSLTFIAPAEISNVYLHYILLLIADFISAFPFAYGINEIGRKKVTMISFFVTSFSFLMGALIPYIVVNENLLEISVITLSVISRIGVAGMMFLMSVYTVELFPTTFRSTAYGVCVFMGRIGGIAASNLFIFSNYIGVSAWLVLGLVNIIPAGLSMLLEETNKKPMKEVIENSQREFLLINE